MQVHLLHLKYKHFLHNYIYRNMLGLIGSNIEICTLCTLFSVIQKKAELVKSRTKAQKYLFSIVAWYKLHFISRYMTRNLARRW